MSRLIFENQRGLLYRDGRLVRVLSPGRHHFVFGFLETLSIDEPIHSEFSSVDHLKNHSELVNLTTFVSVPDGFIVLHYVNGMYRETLKTGQYLFWNADKEHVFESYDLSEPEIPQTMPRSVLAKLPADMVQRINVPNEKKAVLSIDSAFVNVLEPGTYHYWKGVRQVECTMLDARILQIDISGQEILTADKVSVRMNLICTYRIVDFRRIKIEIANFEEQLHVAVQLAIREYVGKLRLDEILENKDKISEYLLDRLKSQASNLSIEILSSGVKDIILPGEIRDIMNTVLVAEKRAQANVITRREEVASTRSLLNTAKLMEENTVLMRLKEMEYLERIFERVSNITLNGSTDVMTQLMALIQSRKPTE